MRGARRPTQRWGVARGLREEDLALEENAVNFFLDETEWPEHKARDPPPSLSLVPEGRGAYDIRL